jgi:hypothetical protein
VPFVHLTIYTFAKTNEGLCSYVRQQVLGNSVSDLRIGNIISKYLLPIRKSETEFCFRFTNLHLAYTLICVIVCVIHTPGIEHVLALRHRLVA